MTYKVWGFHHTIIFCVFSAVYCHVFIPPPVPLIAYAHYSSMVQDLSPLEHTNCFWVLHCGGYKENWGLV